MRIPYDQVQAWQRDRQGVIVDDTLAKNYGWKLGDRIFIHGDLCPVNLELNVRGIFHSNPDNKSVYFNKTQTDKAFMLDFVTMLGNVKAFILVICSAVIFAILLVSANTMAMSIRERTSEVAVLKALGFTSSRVLSLICE
jgi:putative ABC transport system permease protein